MDCVEGPQYPEDYAADSTSQHLRASCVSGFSLLTSLCLPPSIIT